MAHAGGSVFTVYAVIGPDGPVIETGAGARLDVTSAGGVRCQAEVHVPLFGQPTAGGAATVLIGSAAGTVDVTLELTLPPGTQTAGVALGGARLTASVPTNGTGPEFGLVLTGLQLPGAAAPADLAVTVTDLASLEHSLIHLVMGLVQAEVSGLPATDPLRGLATMLGLVPGDVPAFPVEELLAHGPGVLAGWLAAALGDPAARTAWLGGVAALAAARSAAPGRRPRWTSRWARRCWRSASTPWPARPGRPRITPTLTLSVTGAPGVTLALEVDPVSIDLGTGAAVAVPALRLTGQLRGSGGPLLPAVTGPAGLSVEIGGLDAGFALDAARRPTLVLQARSATVGASQFAVLDLSSPDALAAAAQDVVAGAATSLLRNLGPAAVAAGVLLGLADPPGRPRTAQGRPGPAAQRPARRAQRVLGRGAHGRPGRGAGAARGPAGRRRRRHPVGRAGDRDRDGSQPVAAATDDRCGPGISYRGRRAVGRPGGLGRDRRPGRDGHRGHADRPGARCRAGAIRAARRAGRRSCRAPAASCGSLYAGGGPLTLGAPPVALTATAAGIGVTWSTGSALTAPAGTPGLRVVPVAEGVALLTPAGQIALPELGFRDRGGARREAWAAVEALVVAGAGR